MTETQARRWLLYDGECDFCRRCADRIERRDKRDRLRVIAY